MDEEMGYRTADSFFINARHTSIQEDVAEQVRREYDRPVPFCETTAGQQARQWSGLLDKPL